MFLLTTKKGSSRLAFNFYKTRIPNGFLFIGFNFLLLLLFKPEILGEKEKDGECNRPRRRLLFWRRRRPLEPMKRCLLIHINILG